MMGLLIALVIIVLLAALPIGISIQYDSQGAQIRILAGFLRFKIGSNSKKKKKPQNNQKAKSKALNEKPKDKPTGGSVTDFLPLAKMLLALLDDLRWKMRVSRLDFRLIMAGGDPCDLANNYAKAWLALGNLWPRLESFLIIKKRDVEIECDFFSDKTTVYARVDLTITIGRLVRLCLKRGLPAFREFSRVKNLRKGGALK